MTANPRNPGPDPNRDSERRDKLDQLLEKLNEITEEQGESVEGDITEEQVRALLQALKQEQKPEEFLGDNIPNNVRKEFFGDPVEYAG